MSFGEGEEGGMPTRERNEGEKAVWVMVEDGGNDGASGKEASGGREWVSGFVGVEVGMTCAMGGKRILSSDWSRA